MAKKTSRRKFLNQSTKAALGIGIANLTVANLLTSCKTARVIGIDAPIINFHQTPLPYGYKDLESFIDALTMEIHYSKHAKSYASNLQAAAIEESIALTTPLERFFNNTSAYSTNLTNNAGGHYNHELFWRCMKPNGGGLPTGKLFSAIQQSFGSFEAFQSEFSTLGKHRFGSGWAWLYLDGNNQLKIGSTANQDNPLMSTSSIKGKPLLGLDVWEHAYYLKYQNKRSDYITAWWNVVNWKFVEQRFEA